MALWRMDISGNEKGKVGLITLLTLAIRLDWRRGGRHRGGGGERGRSKRRRLSVRLMVPSVATGPISVQEEWLLMLDVTPKKGTAVEKDVIEEAVGRSVVTRGARGIFRL